MPDSLDVERDPHVATIEDPGVVMKNTHMVEILELIKCLPVEDQLQVKACILEFKPILKKYSRIVALTTISYIGTELKEGL